MTTPIEPERSKLESERRDGLEYAHAPCGLVTTSLDGSVQRANPTFVEMIGYPDEHSLQGHRFGDLLSGGGRILYDTHLAPMLRVDRAAHSIALDLVRPDRTRVPALVNLAVERDADEPQRIHIAVFEASERRQYEREVQRAKERAEAAERDALDLAKTLQQVLLPPEIPDTPGLDIAAAFHPAGVGELIGGDFYDVFDIGTSDWFLIMGDVCGKGPDAAVVSAFVRHTIRGAAARYHSPADVLTVTNEALLVHGSDRFCTAAVVRVRHVSGGRWRTTVATAGHPLPIVRRADGRMIEHGRYGDLLGVYGNGRFWDVHDEIAGGDALVLYTDGVTEARRGRQLFGADRLESVIRSATGSSAQTVGRIVEHALDFQQGVPADDLAIIVVRPRSHGSMRPSALDP